MRIDWKKYDPGEFYDELISTPGNPRTAARSLARYLGSLSEQQLNRRQNRLRTGKVTSTWCTDARKRVAFQVSGGGDIRALATHCPTQRRGRPLSLLDLAFWP